MDSLLTRPRLQLLLWGAVALISLIVAIALASSSNSDSGFRFLGLGAGEASQTTLTTDRQTDLLGGDNGAPVQQDSVADFTARHGDPPYTDFARMRIPAIGVNAPVGRWLVDGSIMQDPYGPVDVAFYDLSDWPGMGGFPGQGQNAIFGAHVDLNRHIRYADEHYRGPAVFWALDELVPGSIIEIDYAGETLRYAVTWIQDLDANASDWAAIFSSNVPVDSITLYTCGGQFDLDSRSYSHRTVVRAERV